MQERHIYSVCSSFATISYGCMALLCLNAILIGHCTIATAAATSTQQQQSQHDGQLRSDHVARRSEAFRYHIRPESSIAALLGSTFQRSHANGRLPSVLETNDYLATARKRQPENLPLSTSKNINNAAQQHQQPDTMDDMDFLLDDQQVDAYDKPKRFDDYGHMRFGKRGAGDDSDDYGHMRFGKRGELLK